MKFFVLLIGLIILYVLNGSPIVQLPDSFSWANNNNISYLNYVQNQNFPHVCNSGWAFSAINSLNSRIKIRRNSSYPDITLSTQVLLSCDDLDYGCLGGEPLTAYRWISINNITDQSCQGYIAKGYTNGAGCSSQRKCQICIDSTCKPQQRAKIYTIDKYGILNGEDNMMQQIYRFGPISCGIAVSSALKNYTKGILEDKSNNKIDHFVLVYGWGQDQNGKKFWNVMNSWGNNWGENGHFRILKGQNNLAIQSICYWAALRDTWTLDIRNQTLATPKNQQKPKMLTKILRKQKRKTLNIGGQYLVPSRSSANPQYCESSWAFAITTMMSDRLFRNTKGLKYLIFSVQALYNCGIGQCQKQGDPFSALTFIHKYGIPQQSCQSYRAQNPLKQSCTNLDNCASCQGTLNKQYCTEIKNYKRWKIFDYGTLSGSTQMKKQIESYGPIVCGVYASDKFKKYQGGLFSQISAAPKVNHYVEVIGWKQQAGQDYWKVRNFWGTAWGQSGFIWMQMNGNNLGLQSKCYWAGSIL